MNTYAFRAQRMDPKNGELDYFPTPPWATRALLEHVIKIDNRAIVLEPACGAGHMVRAIQEYTSAPVRAFDIVPRGKHSTVQDYMTWVPDMSNRPDWIITNPPFNLAEEFIIKSLRIATTGVAIFARTSFIESVGRWNRLFNPFPPKYFAPFTERVPLLKGRLDKNGTTATSYSWFVWENTDSSTTEVKWIPPCRKILDKDSDYDN
jgi:hypothetical protein